MSLSLRPYQLEAKAAVAEPCEKPSLIVLPTGTGKTVVFSSLIAERGSTSLILAHRDELLGQAEEKLLTVAPELAMAVGRVQAERNDTGAQIIVASVQTLARQARLDQLPRHFKTVVIDEAHHAVADSYKRILDHVSDSDLILGFTATAGRRGLGDLFDLRHSKSLLEMIVEGYLSDLRGMRVELELDLSDVRRSNRGRGDFVDADLGEALEAADASDRTVDAYREHAADRRGLVFCPTVAVSKQMAESFEAAGIRAAHLDGTTPKDERAGILRALSAGELQVVSNCGVLTEGYDEPSIDCVVIARPTKSEILYAQMVGRGTRLHPGKDDCLVLDLVGTSDELSLEGVAKLVGARDIRPDETATEAVERNEAEAAAEAKTEQERLEAERVRKAKLRARKFGFFNRDRIHWQRVGERLAVDVGRDEAVLLDPQGGGKYRVLVLQENSAKICAEGLDLGYAQGLAEDIIRECGGAAIADTEAAWRQRPASKGQRNMARRVGAEIPVVASQGEASDIISRALLEQKLQRLDRALAAREKEAV